MPWTIECSAPYQGVPEGCCGVRLSTPGQAEAEDIVVDERSIERSLQTLLGRHDVDEISFVGWRYFSSSCVEILL